MLGVPARVCECVEPSQDSLDFSGGEVRFSSTSLFCMYFDDFSGSAAAY